MHVKLLPYDFFKTFFLRNQEISGNMALEFRTILDIMVRNSSMSPLFYYYSY